MSYALVIINCFSSKNNIASFFGKLYSAAFGVVSKEDFHSLGRYFGVHHAQSPQIWATLDFFSILRFSILLLRSHAEVPQADVRDPGARGVQLEQLRTVLANCPENVFIFVIATVSLLQQNLYLKAVSSTMEA